MLFSELHGADWYLRAVGVMTLIAGIGIVARAVRLGPVPVLALQLVAGFEYLLIMFTSSRLAAGVLPTRSAVRQLGDLLRDSVARGFRLVPARHPRCGGDVRRRGRGGDPGVAHRFRRRRRRSASRWPGSRCGRGRSSRSLWEQESAALFLAPAAGFLLLLADNRDRLAPRIGAVALSVSMVVPYIAPHVNGVYESHKGIGMPEKAKTITTLDPLVSMRGDLIQPTDTDLITVRTDSAHPGDLYLRAVTLDDFDGVQWKAGKRTVSTFDAQLPGPPGLSSTVSTSPVDNQIKALAGLESDYLPMPYPATRLTVTGQWRLDPLTQNIVSHDGRKQISGLQYTVQSLDVDATPSDVAGAVMPSPYLAPYLQTPPNLPASIKQQAAQITGGSTRPVPDRSGTAELVHRARQLHVRPAHAPGNRSTRDLRLPRVPPRVLRTVRRDDGRDGPSAGRARPGERRLHRRPARRRRPHPNHQRPRRARLAGAVVAEHRLDPLRTDSRERQLEPARAELVDGQAAAEPETGDRERRVGRRRSRGQRPARPARPQPLGTNQYDCAAAPDAPQCQSSNAPQTPDHPNHPHSAAFLILIWLVPLLLLLAGPALIRELRRRRRWALIAAARLAGAQSTVAAEAAWRELRDTALDLGYAWPVARTPRQTAAQLVTDGRLTPLGDVALVHVSSTIERARYARPANAITRPDQLRSAVNRVQYELREHAGWPRRIRAAFLPPSLWESLRTVRERPVDTRRLRALLPRRASN